MATKSKFVEPDWINEKAACEWIGCNRSTLLSMRTTHGLNYTYLRNGRNPMYDRNELKQILFNNSTYAMGGLQLSQQPSASKD